MMKKAAVFCLAVALSVGAAFAQGEPKPLDKGTFNIGGAVSFTSSSGDWYGDDAISSFSLMPAVRYFVIDGLAVGVDLLLLTNSDGDDTETTFGIGPVVVYMFDTGSPQFYPYIGAGVGIGSHKWSDADDSTSAFRIQLGGGVAIMLNPNLAVTAELGYYIESFKYGDWDAESGGTFALSVGLSAFLHPKVRARG